MNLFELITPYDTAVIDFIQTNFKTGIMDALMAFFSYLGESGILWIVTGLMLIVFRKTRAAGVMVITAVAFGFIIGELCIKNIVCRPRPFYANPDIVLNISPPSGFSYPSGHSCSSFAAAVVLFMRDKRLGIPAICVASLIAFSRLYNYVHYPSDVISGILLGIISAILVVYVLKRSKIERKLSEYKKKKA